MASSFNARDAHKTLTTSDGKYTISSLPKLTKLGFGNAEKLPFSIKILLESAVRNCDNYQVTLEDIRRICEWSPKTAPTNEIAFKPARVLLQDFTGVPCVVDLAALRSAMKRFGGDITKINPQVPCDLVIDHSLQIDAFGTKNAVHKNTRLEFKRNNERYAFLKWGQSTLKNFSVIPPGTGIIHQVNLEYLAHGVMVKRVGKENVAYPDSLVGTDSHTTMINGLGIIGWGVGGIEAEAVMLGEPISMLLPEVIGVNMTGELRDGVNATDLVLTVTEMLRKKGVVGKFVEFYGEGIRNLSLPDRATVSNMSPEYGATIGIFPVDKETLAYYRLTGRPQTQVDLIERYMKEQGLFYNERVTPTYTDTLTLDLGSIEPCLAGPKRPQDRVRLGDMAATFKQSLTAPVTSRGFGIAKADTSKTVEIDMRQKSSIGHGAVVLASITSCTNTSNPSVLIEAALLAKKAIKKGLTVKEYVKTSFAPGSQVVEEYLDAAGLMPYLEKLKFHIVGYGCATCIGNSGPLPEPVVNAIKTGNLVTASVLSGNRNFEGRINPHVKANYLASPALVVAYAIAGTVDIDLTKTPIGKDHDGKRVYLADIWPHQHEVNAVIKKAVNAAAFRKRYAHVATANKAWNAIKSPTTDIFAWNSRSTYIQEPPFFMDIATNPTAIQPITDARVLVKVGDSITTDHISPAGSIAQDSPAGKYLINCGVAPADFNSYGARRGNDRVMTRGTFANIRLRNQLVPGSEGSWTMHFPTNTKMTIYDAAQEYAKTTTPLIVIAGKEYGTGSSRDWAAKGTALLGVTVVIAQSYERIHRSNLAGMGIIPLEFTTGESAESLGLTGEETFDLNGLTDAIKPRQAIPVIARRPDGSEVRFTTTLRLDTPVEIDYVRNGGILQTVLRKLR